MYGYFVILAIVFLVHASQSAKLFYYCINMQGLLKNIKQGIDDGLICVSPEYAHPLTYDFGTGSSGLASFFGGGNTE